MWQRLTDDKPIIACSTGYESNHAIGLIRLSGFHSLNDFQSFFSLNLNKVKPRYVYLTNLLIKGKKQDEVTLTFFKGPKSYNGENIIELGVHGNRLNINIILEAFIDSGLCRLANPGEFSFRALKNKKMTLSQVEGLDLFINGQSEMALSQGLGTLNGELKENFENLRESFIKLKASVEISIDFLEDVGEQKAQENFQKSLNEFSKICEGLYKRTQSSNSSLRNPSIVLLGKTNAGKSSLFNQLLSQDRSIVSSIAGTTRDYISENLLIEKVNYRLIDTAGIRETKDEIEEKGIGRARALIKNAFFRILVINPFDDAEIEENLKEDIDLFVFTHKDQEGFSKAYEKFSNKIDSSKSLSVALIDSSGPIGPEESGSIGPQNQAGSIGPENQTGPIGPHNATGSIGPGLDELTKLISNKYLKLQETNPILIDRHCHEIKEIHKLLKLLEGELEQNTQDIGIIDFHIQQIGQKINELIGVIYPDEVLNDIFSNFCIGK